MSELGKPINRPIYETGIESDIGKTETKSCTLAEMMESKVLLEYQRDKMTKDIQDLSGKISDEQARIRNLAKDLNDTTIDSVIGNLGCEDDIKQALILCAKIGRDNFRRNY